MVQLRCLAPTMLAGALLGVSLLARASSNWPLLVLGLYIAVVGLRGLRSAGRAAPVHPRWAWPAGLLMDSWRACSDWPVPWSWPGSAEDRRTWTIRAPDTADGHRHRRRPGHRRVGGRRSDEAGAAVDGMAGAAAGGLGRSGPGTPHRWPSARRACAAWSSARCVQRCRDGRPRCLSATSAVLVDASVQRSVILAQKRGHSVAGAPRGAAAD